MKNSINAPCNTCMWSDTCDHRHDFLNFYQNSDDMMVRVDRDGDADTFSVIVECRYTDGPGLRNIYGNLGLAIPSYCALYPQNRCPLNRLFNVGPNGEPILHKQHRPAIRPGMPASDFWAKVKTDKDYSHRCDCCKFINPPHDSDYMSISKTPYSTFVTTTVDGMTQKHVPRREILDILVNQYNFIIPPEYELDTENTNETFFLTDETTIVRLYFNHVGAETPVEVVDTYENMKATGKIKMLSLLNRDLIPIVKPDNPNGTRLIAPELSDIAIFKLPHSFQLNDHVQIHNGDYIPYKYVPPVNGSEVQTPGYFKMDTEADGAARSHRNQWAFDSVINIEIPVGAMVRIDYNTFQNLQISETGLKELNSGREIDIASESSGNINYTSLYITMGADDELIMVPFIASGEDGIDQSSIPYVKNLRGTKVHSTEVTPITVGNVIGKHQNQTTQYRPIPFINPLAGCNISRHPEITLVELPDGKTGYKSTDPMLFAFPPSIGFQRPFFDFLGWTKDEKYETCDQSTTIIDNITNFDVMADLASVRTLVYDREADERPFDASGSTLYACWKINAEKICEYVKTKVGEIGADDLLTPDNPFICDVYHLQVSNRRATGKNLLDIIKKTVPEGFECRVLMAENMSTRHSINSLVTSGMEIKFATQLDGKDYEGVTIEITEDTGALIRESAYYDVFIIPNEENRYGLVGGWNQFTFYRIKVEFSQIPVDVTLYVAPENAGKGRTELRMKDITSYLFEPGGELPDDLAIVNAYETCDHPANCNVGCGVACWVLMGKDADFYYIRDLNVVVKYPVHITVKTEVTKYNIQTVYQSDHIVLSDECPDSLNLREWLAGDSIEFDLDRLKYLNAIGSTSAATLLMRDEAGKLMNLHEYPNLSCQGIFVMLKDHEKFGKEIVLGMSPKEELTIDLILENAALEPKPLEPAMCDRCKDYVQLNDKSWVKCKLECRDYVANNV